MIEIKEKLKSSLATLENIIIFEEHLINLLEAIRKNYFIPSITPLHNIVRLMSMCLVYDYFISVFHPQNQDMKFLGELHVKRSELIKKIKEDQSVLTMQSKMKQTSKTQSLSIVVTKMASQVLNENRVTISEDTLFKRLNFLLNGSNISKKCYKLSLNRVTQNFAMPSQCKIQKRIRHTISGKQNILFKQIFHSLSIKNLSKPTKSQQRKQDVDSNSKVGNILSKVKLTIQQEKKNFSIHEGKKTKRKSLSVNKIKQFDETELEQKEKQKNKDGKSQVNDASAKKISNRMKRTGTFQRDKTRSKILRLNDSYSNSRNINNHMHEEQENDSNISSAPEIDQNWYQPIKKPKTKRVFTLHLPNFCNRKNIQFNRFH